MSAPVPDENGAYSPADYTERNRALIDDLVLQGWSRQPDYFPASLVTALHDNMRAQDEAGRLTQAAIGRDQTAQQQAAVRNDRTQWLTGEQDAPRLFLGVMERLRLDLNAALFLGVFEYEAHYALYPPGGFYKKHRDSFHGAKNRLVSTVTYLTPDWAAADGGHLVLYDDHDENKELARILPEAGTLAVFLSEAIPHEVLPPARARASIAGWFRCNSSTGNRVDPLR